MATVEEMQERVDALKKRLQEKVEKSEDPSVDRIVRLARKKLKRAQRKLRLQKGKAEKTASTP